MNSLLVTTMAGCAGTAAFGILYHVKPKHLFFAMVGGGLTTLSLLLCLQFTHANQLLSNIAATIIGGIYCLLCARLRKAPSTVFMIPTLFPLVPGRNLYFSMIALTHHDKTAFISNFSAAVEISFGIAVGILFVNLFGNLVMPRLPQPTEEDNNGTKPTK